MIESWGRGMERIMTACKTAKVLTPKLRYERTGILVEFKVPGGVQPEEADMLKGSVKTAVKILQVLENNPEMTLVEVAENIGKSRRTVEQAASKLVKEGRLKYVGPQKGGHWEVAK